jgi:two-component system, LytTR family, response regulator
MITVLIIDDEKRTRDLIAKIIQSFDFPLAISTEGSSVESGIQSIDRLKPQIVLLDIQLPDGTGFEVLKATQHKDFCVIFITAHEEYAIKAIKFSALDYILKPIEPDELQAAISKAVESEQQKQSNLQMEALQFNVSTPPKRRLVLKTLESVHVVELDSIIRCEADRNYTTFYLDNGNKIFVSKTLKEYEVLLSNYNFLRVQQSHLINIDFVDRYNKVDGGSVVMKDGSHIPLSPAKRDVFFKILETI